MATSSAANHPARAPNSARPATNATGIESQGERDRHRVRVRLAEPEDAHPEVQQQVVERRRPVLAQHAGHVEERVRGDADRQALVDPVARVDRLRAQREREAGEEGEAEREADRDRQRPNRAAGARSRASGAAIVLTRPPDGRRPTIRHFLATASVWRSLGSPRPRSVGLGRLAGIDRARNTTAGRIAGGSRPGSCADAGSTRRPGPGTARCRCRRTRAGARRRRPARPGRGPRWSAGLVPIAARSGAHVDEVRLREHARRSPRPRTIATTPTPGDEPSERQAQEPADADPGREAHERVRHDEVADVPREAVVRHERDLGDPERGGDENAPDDGDLAERGHAARKHEAAARGRRDGEPERAGRASTGCESIAWNWSSDGADRVVGERRAVRARVLRAVHRRAAGRPSPTTPAGTTARAARAKPATTSPRSARLAPQQPQAVEARGTATPPAAAAPRRGRTGTPAAACRRAGARSPQQHERDEQPLGVAHRAVAQRPPRERVRHGRRRQPAGSPPRRASEPEQQHDRRRSRPRGATKTHSVRRERRRTARTAS